MKRYLFAVFFCIMLIFLSACSSKDNTAAEKPSSPTVVPRSETAAALPEGSLVFDVVNMIGGDIYEMHISPNALDDFGDDILSDDILSQGERQTVSFVPEDTYEYWDIRVLTENGNIYTWQNVEFGKFTEITLYLGDNGPEFSVI